MSLFAIIAVVLLLVIGIVLLVFFFFNTYGFFTGAPFAATPSTIIDSLFSLVDITEKDVVYDLGSGDGRVLIAAANKGAKSIGWEINLPLYYYSLRQLKRSKINHKVTIHYGNFWNKKLSDATVIFAFLLPEYMDRLEKKIRREVSPGVRVVTYLAKLPNSKPIAEKDGLTVYKF